jgi:hypothetical protein
MFTTARNSQEKYGAESKSTAKTIDMTAKKSAKNEKIRKEAEMMI